jgi:hypothetical protein
MKLAEKLANKIKKNEGSANSMGALDKKAMGIVEMLKKESYAKDNKMQEKMCDEMKKLAEMDSEVANEFMGYMDEMSSKYEMKKAKDEAKKKKSEEADDEEDDDDAEDDEDDKEESDDDDDSDKHKKKKDEKK